MTLTADDIRLLTKPFSIKDHEFTRGYVYISEAAITARLDEVDPAWTFEIQQLSVRARQGVCAGRMTVKGVTRENVGMQPVEYLKDKQTKEETDIEAGEPEKGAATDAIKRCARLFGVGRYLLDSPPRVSEVNGRTEDAKFNEWLKAKQNAWAEANAPKTDAPPAPAPTPEPEAPAPNVTPFPPQTNASAEFDAAFPPNPTPEWVKDKKFTDAIFKKANASFSMSDYQVLEALNVKAITLYTGTKDEAFAAIKAYAERRLQDAS